MFWRVLTNRFKENQRVVRVASPSGQADVAVICCVMNVVFNVCGRVISGF